MIERGEESCQMNQKVLWDLAESDITKELGSKHMTRLCGGEWHFAQTDLNMAAEERRGKDRRG